ncbi:MAG: single-stranded-DNA-specific exonuclease RecJ [Dehalococcoidia bacterium]|nr:single-stranded-DNA-specific exonuclease RecJ [Dehalococcoidia bacterium]
MLPPAPHQYLVGNSSIPPLITQLLFNRGLKEPAQVASFLDADESLSNDPLLLTDMHLAIARIYRALLSGEPIAIYGDYDADGITATALLVQGLSALGGTVIPYIPHRLTEGYGLKTTALENLRQQGIGLVVTVDCGITSLSEVKKAQRMGLDIVITDHHTPLPEMPPAVAIVNPKLAGSAYPFTELTGVGVAFKLLQALYQSIGRGGQLEELVDLAALGTVADMSPLLGENRYLVKEGLKLMNRSPRLGIRALIEQAELSGGILDAECISWVIAPRLNAAGRMENAMASYKLLMTDSPTEARRLARWLEQKNAERQKLTASTVARARQQVLSQGISPLLVASDGDYFLGIAGLVASRLADEFYRPTLVVRTGEKVSSGSCRSIPEFNIIAALTESRHLLSQFGGHSQAAGFTLPTRNLPRLEETLLNLATDQLRGVDLRPTIDIDAEVALPDLGGDTFQMTQQLAPFGRGNPLPTYLSRRVEVMDCRTMGNGGEHLRFRLGQGGTRWDGVAFRLGNYLADVAPALDIVYNLEIDRWRGKETLRLNIMDFAPAGQS